MKPALLWCSELFSEFLIRGVLWEWLVSRIFIANYTGLSPVIVHRSMCLFNTNFCWQHFTITSPIGSLIIRVHVCVFVIIRDCSFHEQSVLKAIHVLVLFSSLFMVWREAISAMSLCWTSKRARGTQVALLFTSPSIPIPTFLFSASFITRVWSGANRTAPHILLGQPTTSGHNDWFIQFQISPT